MNQSTYKKLNETIRQLYLPADAGDLRQRTVELARKLIPSEVGRYAELKPDGNGFENEYCSSRPEEFERFRPFFNAHIEDQPVVNYYRRHRQSRVLRISDLVPTRDFRKTAIYNEFYRRIGIRHQLTTALFSKEGRCREIILDREKKDFTRTEVRMLEFFTPHLEQAFFNVVRMDALEAENTRLRHSLEATGEGFLLATSKGRILYRSQKAGAFLGQTGEANPHNPGELSATLKEFLDRMIFREANPLSDPDPASKLVLYHPGGRIIVRYSSLPRGHSGPAEYLLILREAPAETSCCKPLRSLGLTRRQTEILQAIAHGKTDGEIAGCLGISPRTVHKHLENIYETLEVNNRVDASRRAFEVFADGAA